MCLITVAPEAQTQKHQQQLYSSFWANSTISSSELRFLEFSLGDKFTLAPILIRDTIEAKKCSEEAEVSAEEARESSKAAVQKRQKRLVSSEEACCSLHNNFSGSGHAHN